MSQNSLTDLVNRLVNQISTYATVADGIYKVVNVIKNASALQNMVEFENTLQTNNPQKIQRFFSSLPKTCKNMLSEETRQKLSNQKFYDCFDDKQNQVIVDETKECQSKLVDTILFKEIFIALAILGSQTYSLMNLANELEQADNLIKESKKEIKKIKINLENVKKEQINMSQTLANIKETEIDSTELILQASVIARLSFSLSTTCLEIQSLKIEVNGKIKTLKTERKGAGRDIFVNSVQVLSNVIELAVEGNMFSKLQFTTKCISTTLFATFGAIKFGQYCLTEKRVEELSKILTEVESLETEAEAIKEIIQNAMELIKKFKLRIKK